MDKETKVLLGKLLGEIYRIQKRIAGFRLWGFGR